MDNIISSLSKLCFGCEPLGGADWGKVELSSIAEAVSRALDLGVNFFDTADVYGLGLSEIRLSEILGSRRHDVVIASKGGMSWKSPGNGARAVISRNSSPNYLAAAVEASLKRLRLDCIPIYYVHWPDPNTDIRISFEALSKLKDQGKIKYLGCSNFDVTQIKLASEVAEISFLQLPVNLLTGDIDSAIISIAHQKSIGIVAYNVLANGILTGKYAEDSIFGFDDRRSRLPIFNGELYKTALSKVKDISVIANSKNLTCAQYAISSVLKKSGIISAIVGIKNSSQVEENFLDYKDDK